VKKSGTHEAIPGLLHLVAVAIHFVPIGIAIAIGMAIAIDVMNSGSFGLTLVGPIVFLSTLDLKAQHHNCEADLANGEEAPNRGLLVQVVSNQLGQNRASEEENGAVEPHVHAHSKVGSEHHEAVDAVARHEVRGRMQGHLPSNVVVATEGARFLTAKPFSVIASSNFVLITEENPTAEHPDAHNQSQLANHVHLILLALTAHEGTGEGVGEVWLEADVQEANNSEPLVDGAGAIIHPEKLEELQNLHRHEIPAAH